MVLSVCGNTDHNVKPTATFRQINFTFVAFTSNINTTIAKYTQSNNHSGRFSHQESHKYNRERGGGAVHSQTKDQL